MLAKCRALVLLVTLLPTATDLEEDMLDKAWGLTSQSRLACQARLQQTDITIEIPKYTVNHARENH
jgi:ferredoxin, 2Fe-2S